MTNLEILNSLVSNNLIDSYDLKTFISDILDDIGDTRIYPKNKKKHVGVEIEFVSNSDRIDILIDLIKNNLIKKVSLGYDSSISCDWGENDYEIRVIDTEKNISETLKKVCKILKKHKAKVNDSCGLHVHLDCRNRDKNKVYQNFVKAQKLLYKMVDPNRIMGDYSRFVRLDLDYETSGHSYGIEISRYNTIEVRLHHGTVNYDEINNWVKLLTKIANKKTEYKKDHYKTEKSLIRFSYMKNDMKKYINKVLTKQKKKFNKLDGYVRDEFNSLLNY